MAHGGGGKDPTGLIGMVLSLLTGIPFLGSALGALNKYATPGQPPTDPSTGGPNNFWSGPGAAFGPPGSTLGGTGDIGRPAPMDGTDSAGLGNVGGPGGSAAPPAKGRGGGGGGGGTYVFHPYGGLQGQGSFVNWDPTYPGQTPDAATFTSGSGSSDRRPAAPPPARGGRQAGGSGSDPDGGTGGPGRPVGGRGGPGKGQGKVPSPQAPGGPLGPPGKPSKPVNPGNQAAGGAGVDTNQLGRGTPGWMQDPTTGIQDTSGMPMGTLPAWGPGESYQDYMTQLHDAGWSQDSIASILGPYGLGPGGKGPGPTGEGWNWGTGPVVLGPAGYQFMNQLGGQGIGATGPSPAGGGVSPMTQGPWSPGALQGNFAASGGVGGQNVSEKPNAADALIGGILGLIGGGGPGGNAFGGSYAY
jgi:hypothetical protein